MVEYPIHNLFKKDMGFFVENDPNLSNLKGLKYVFIPSLIREIPISFPGIYILTGGRQVGKSTLIKLLIKRLLLEEKIPAEHIFYIPCDLIQHYNELVMKLQNIFDESANTAHIYLFLDEITYVTDWDRVIKHFADLGYFQKNSILITGSDSVILRESMKRFPGRRGMSDRTDFHFYPISFSEYVCLTKPELTSAVNDITKLKNIINEPCDDIFNALKGMTTDDFIGIVANCFNEYLLTGGFLSAINTYRIHNEISRYVYQTYQQWVIGDFLKRNKKEYFLKELVLALSDRLTKQITLHNIASATEIQHHNTVQEYLKILEDMDVLFMQLALREDAMQPAIKKAKKAHFTDPFIAQSLITWAKDIANPWDFVKNNLLTETPLKSELAESCVISLFKRTNKTLYIKNDGEVDMAIIIGNKFTPIEIKWTTNIRKSELKQILKYKSGIIAYRGNQFGKYEHLYVLPIPVLALFE